MGVDDEQQLEVNVYHSSTRAKHRQSPLGRTGGQARDGGELHAENVDRKILLIQCHFYNATEGQGL